MSFYLTQIHTHSHTHTHMGGSREGGGTSVLNTDQIHGDFAHNTILLGVLEFVSSWWHSLHFELTLISFCKQWNVWISVAFRPAICTISNSKAVRGRAPSNRRGGGVRGGPAAFSGSLLASTGEAEKPSEPRETASKSTDANCPLLSRRTPEWYQETCLTNRRSNIFFTKIDLA